MTYSTLSKDKAAEITYDEEVVSREIVDRFSLVMKVDSKGRVADVVVNAPTKVLDPEIVAKISLIMSTLAENLLKYVDSQKVEEINVSFNNGILLIIPEGNAVRVALTTST